MEGTISAELQLLSIYIVEYVQILCMYVKGIYVCMHACMYRSVCACIYVHTVSTEEVV